ncbi:12531_t:CDS:10 [Cetraspora pellucida]|uniref:Disintegrin and metalloproteinase domain-containing protein B n=1 Tax=Cetraspora pellucida TaxID=1433469 RepID=A0A9N9BJC0_9GLOM|nr:12531_t:CDS:10 [Cetraspora pellucida]
MEILPRNRFDATSLSRRDFELDSSLQHDDSLRLKFVAFNRTFNIHLEPNTDIFHPEATITIHHKNKTSTTTRLIPQDYRLYKGVLLDVDSTDRRLSEDIVGLKRLSLHEELSTLPSVLGWARIIVLNDGSLNNKHLTFEGTFSYMGDLHHIKSIDKFQVAQFRDDPEIPNPSSRHSSHRDATMVIYRDSDIKQSNKGNDDQVWSCAMNEQISNRNRSDRHYVEYHKPWIFGINDKNNVGTENWLFNLGFNVRTISRKHKLSKRATSGCPTARRIAYMGAAADCTYVESYKSSDAARQQILSDWGTASAVYERTFNVTLGLIYIEIQDSTCPSTPNPTWNRPCSDSYSISDRLSDFSQWRGDDGAALWHLMSKCNTGTKVGIAWLGQLCQTSASSQSNGTGQAYVSGAGVSTIVKDEWKVVAHEIGHGFGAYHDCTASTCPCSNVNDACGCCPLSQTTCDAGGQYIMNPTSNVITNDFSPCSINDICTTFPNIGTCLQDPATSSKTILTTAMCGNGLKESGEECDCGTDCAKDPCCDGATCKLKNGSKCDDTNDLCCRNCTYKPANETCRPAVSSCDIPEVCPGNSGDCPPDSHIQDGTSCGSGLQCAGGICTSRDLQCATRGSRMGITKACAITSYSSCTISCANPNDTTQCLEMSGYFVDGTPCGFGGKCSKGSCITGSVGWINQNKNIAIPVAIILGILITLWSKRQRRFTTRVPSIPPDEAEAIENSNYNINNTGWVDPTPYNGPSTSGERHPHPRDQAVNTNNGSRSPGYQYTEPLVPINSPPTTYNHMPRSAPVQQMYSNSLRPSSPGSTRNYEAPRSPRNYEAPRSPRNYEAPRSPGNYEAPRSPRNYETPRNPRNYEAPRNPRNHNHFVDPTPYNGY